MTTTVEGLTLRRKNIFAEAFEDVFRGAGYWRLWTALAWHAMRQRYRRSWIGIGWLGVSFAVFMTVKIFIFGGFMSSDMGYYAGHLTIGYLIYRLISNAVTGSCAVFVGAQTWIKSEPLPLSVHVYKMMMNNFIIFAITAVPALAICAYVGAYNIMALVWLLPSLALYAFTTVCIGLLLGVISARYRDIMHFSQTAMQVAYFLSPILWIPPETGPRAMAAFLNPITHYVALLRQPMLEGTIPLLSWVISLSCSLVIALLAILFFATSRRKLILWL